MEENITYISLEEITSKIGSGATPKGGDESYKESGISLIRSLNVYDFDFNYKDLAFIDEKQAEKLKNVTVLANDILLNITGASVGRCCIVPDDVLPARVNQHVAIIRINEASAVSRYIYYVINSSAYKNALLNLSQTGATREALTKDDICRFKVPLPPLTIQQQIAAILSAYDDLIETNNQRIATLEQLAQQIYKEWFVRMRFPGWENTLFHHGVPEGWKIENFDKFCLLQRGYDLPDENIKEGIYPVMASTSIKAYHNEYKVEPPVITTGRSGSLGTVMFSHQKAWPLNTALFVKNFYNNSPYLVFYTLKSLKLENFNAGAGVPSLNRNHLQAIKIRVPSKDIQNQFDKIVSDIFNQVVTLEDSNAILQKTKNLLLPRLISGKLTLK
jgi:type I restriction enzyme, S subunit